MKIFPLIIFHIFLETNLGLGHIPGRQTKVHPFYALVIIRDQTCSGTLVAGNSVLTAARCLYDRRLNEWIAKKEIHVLHGNFSTPNSWQTNYYPTLYYKTHNNYDPSYLGGFGPYDIAIIRLYKDVTVPRGQVNSIPICRLDLAYIRAQYRFATVIGLGLTQQKPKTRSLQLMEAEFERDENYGRIFSDLYRIDPLRQHCYIAMEACVGDSGKKLQNIEPSIRSDFYD